LRECLRAPTRAYAERTFDIGAIADRFEGVIASVVPASSRS
jgi:hypothetical protein